MVHTYMGHNYMGYYCIGHNYVGHNYIGHHYIGQYRRWPTASPVSAMADGVSGIGDGDGVSGIGDGQRRLRYRRWPTVSPVSATASTSGGRVVAGPEVAVQQRLYFWRSALSDATLRFDLALGMPRKVAKTESCRYT